MLLQTSSRPLRYPLLYIKQLVLRRAVGRVPTSGKERTVIVVPRLTRYVRAPICSAAFGARRSDRTLLSQQAYNVIDGPLLPGLRHPFQGQEGLSGCGGFTNLFEHSAF